MLKKFFVQVALSVVIGCVAGVAFYFFTGEFVIPAVFAFLGSMSAALYKYFRYS